MTNDELFSEEIHEIATALAAAQGEFPAIPRSREVLVRPKDASKSPYKFWYATLDGILTAVRPVLSKHGLALTQMVVEKRLRTILMHSSGQYIGHDMPLTYYEAPQQYGSELTYKRRYGVATLLCIAADDDDDGNAAEGNEIQGSRNRPSGKPGSKPVEMPKPKASAAVEALIKEVEDKEKQYTFKPGQRDAARKKYAGTVDLPQATEKDLKTYSVRLDEVLAQWSQYLDLIAACKEAIAALPKEDQDAHLETLSTIKEATSAKKFLELLRSAAHS